MVNSMLEDVTDAVMRSVGASDVLVYRRMNGGRFFMVGTPPKGVRPELLADDEPLVAEALRTGLRRMASEDPQPVCGGYIARSAAIVANRPNVIVVLGRRDGCLAGVADEAFLTAAAVAAENLDV